MGSHLRKKGQQSEPQDLGFESKKKYSMELKAYEEACKVDQDVKNIDEAVQWHIQPTNKGLSF